MLKDIQFNQPQMFIIVMEAYSTYFQCLACFDAILLMFIKDSTLLAGLCSPKWEGEVSCTFPGLYSGALQEYLCMIYGKT